jgi:hypothetical protein
MRPIPSLVTDRLATLYGSLEPAEAVPVVVAVAKDEVPAGRLGTVDEIAAAAAFCALSRQVT